MVRRHAELLAGLSDERGGLTDLRKHMAWYFKGFPVGGELRRALAQVSSLRRTRSSPGPARPRDVPFPRGELGLPRGRQGSPRDRVALPERLARRHVGRSIWISPAAELGVSGG